MKTLRSGFTLLELIIGLVIVTILASLAIPSFSKAIEKTKVKDAQTTLSAIYSAEKIYRLDQGTYGPLYPTLNPPDGLVANRYISDPDPSNNNTNWDFGVVSAADTFTATATRTGGRYNNLTVTLDQNFNGSDYGGTHDLAD